MSLHFNARVACDPELLLPRCVYFPGETIYELSMSGSYYTFNYAFQRQFTLSDVANNAFPYGSGPIPSGLDSVLVYADVVVGTVAGVLYQYDRGTQVWATYGTNACI